MEGLSLVQRRLLALIKLSLGGEIDDCLKGDKGHWKNVFTMALDQTVVGVAFAGLQVLRNLNDRGLLASDICMLPKMKLRSQLIMATEKIKDQNRQHNIVCEKIQKEFASDGLRTTIMKGQANSVLYRSDKIRLDGTPVDLTLYRSTGDIDLWVEGGFEKVNGYVQEKRPTSHVNELEIQYGKYDDVDVEVHHRPFITRNPITNSRLQQFFQSEFEQCFRNQVSLEGKDQSQCTITATTERFNIVHQLAHIKLHLFTEGIGLRQIIDYYFVLLHSHEDKTEMMKIISSLDMERFAAALMWILSTCFGLSESYLLCTPNEKDGRFLLREIMTSGNFGHNDEELNARKEKPFVGLWLFMFRNLRYHRFDHWDWFWGPLWRIYHRAWKIKHHFK